MKIKISIEKEGKKNAKEISLGLKSFVKKTTDSVVKVAKKLENQMDSGELFESAGKCVENAIDKVDEFTQKAQEHVEQVMGEADNIAKKAENYAKHVSDLAKETAEYAKNTFTENKNEAKENMQTPGDGDDYPDEIDKKESAKLALKISQIPEGKTFTLEEYLDYTEEYKCVGTMQPHKNMAMEFLNAISFPCTGNTITAFAKMITIKKLSYKELVYAMSGYYNEGMIGYLKENFKIWLNGRPDVKKYCPNATLWQLLLYFRKKVFEAAKH